MPAYLIGRDDSCGIAYPADETRVSRVHARLTRRGDGSWLLEDMGSINGVFVDGRRVSAAPVTPSSQILLGTLPFVWPPSLLVVEAAPTPVVLQQIPAPSPSRPPPTPAAFSPLAVVGAGLVAVMGIGLVLAAHAPSLKAPSGPDVAAAAPPVAPLDEDFPATNRDLTTDDVWELDQALRRLQGPSLPCDELPAATQQLQTLGARLARSRADAATAAGLPTPEALEQVLSKLASRRLECGEYGC